MRLTTLMSLSNVEEMGKRSTTATPNIFDVAARAGVSVSTVSKALLGSGRISKATRDRVSAAAQELGWKANAVARSLVLGRTHLLGLVVPSISNTFGARVYEGAESLTSEHGYGLLVSVTGDDYKRESAGLQRLRAVVRADGIIASPAPAPPGASSYSTNIGETWPIVLVVRTVEGPDSDFVVCDDRRGGQMATNHLLELGHRRIAFVCDIQLRACSHVNARRAGYRDALESHGIEFDAGLCVGVRPDAGPDKQPALDRLFRSQGPTAVFAHNDRIAQKVLEFLRAKGLDAPAQVALVGFGNLNIGELTTPQITTVDFSMMEVGRLAAQILIDRIEGRSTARHQIIMEPKLIVRASSGGPPASDHGARKRSH
jgi:LacI family transcriptional regulator